MKYSLRSLMLVITLVCVALGGRVEYQRRRGLWHQQEADRYLNNIRKDLELSSNDAVELAEHATNEYSLLIAFPKPGQEFVPNDELVPAVPTDDTCGFLLHRRLAQAYSSAWPWTLLSEKPLRRGEAGLSVEILEEPAHDSPKP
jgi:hypothetical protein